ncbi:hypothetical protein [Cohnella faecalis]|uniref:Uncharacterized protein n=1 Tax=Cohnella faecalis TaxID=2315694 RepID=A0A398D0Q6_9BACL|nr:hypothetical protein [Cohnella faecalis]RIE05081.1 hypothetical protein D3H35_02825 [Cohnella faecalis]
MFLTTTLTTAMNNATFPVTVISSAYQPASGQRNLAIANGMMIRRRAGIRRWPSSSPVSDTYRLQRRMAAEAKFLSVYTQVNEEVWTERERSALGVTEEKFGAVLLMNEMLPDPILESALVHELSKFWAGFETPDEATVRLTDKLRQALELDPVLTEDSV